MFRPEDNLESSYARAALRKFYAALVRGKDRGMFTLSLRRDDRSGTHR